MRVRRANEQLARAALVGVAYYGGAWIGVRATIAPEGIAVVWPPNAVLLAAFLLFPRRNWPWIGLVALGAEITADVPAFPAWAALAFGLVNLFETVLAAWLIRRFVAGPFAFDRLRNGVYFLLSGPLLASALAALFGAAIYLLLGRADTSYLALWRLWWFGDALGLLLLTPLLITLWRHLERRARWLLPWPRRIEALTLCVVVVLLGTLSLMQDQPRDVSFIFTPVLLVPMAIWGAVRFGVLGATATVGLIATLAVSHLMRGIYPYPDLSPQRAVWLTQEYLATIAILAVGLAILLRELLQQRRDLQRQDRELQEQNALLERRIEARTAELERANRSLRAANVQLEKMATTDFLTELANRRHFEALARRQLQRLAQDGATASMILFDMDHFKAINDEYGHDVGDEVLRRIGTPIEETIRPRDLSARTGGEEFAILLADTTRSEALQIAERIRMGIAALVDDPGGLSVPTSASFGVAEWNGCEDLDALVRRADEALYRAKSAGRNRVST